MTTLFPGQIQIVNSSQGLIDTGVSWEISLFFCKSVRLSMWTEEHLSVIRNLRIASSSNPYRHERKSFTCWRVKLSMCQVTSENSSWYTDREAFIYIDSGKERIKLNHTGRFSIVRSTLVSANAWPTAVNIIHVQSKLFSWQSLYYQMWDSWEFFESTLDVC